MEAQDLRRKLTTIMVADIVGFSTLTANDEEWTIRTLGEVRAVVDGIIKSHQGRIFNTGGDSILAEFMSPVEAVRCAIDFQAATRERNLLHPENHQIRYRIGINLGDVLMRDADLLGDGVNVAARLETLAEPGGVCISGTVWDHIHGKLTIAYVDLGDQFVKNIPRPVRAYHLRVGEGEARDDGSVAAGSVSAPRRLAAEPAMTKAARTGSHRLIVWVALGGVALAAAATGAWAWRNAFWGEGSPLKEAIASRLASASPSTPGTVRAAAVMLYPAAPAHKALAVAPNKPGYWVTDSRPTADNARESALEACQIAANTPCILLAVDDEVQPLPAQDAWIAQDMPRTRYRGDFDPSQIPGAWPELRKSSEIAGYAAAQDFKAVAYHPGGVSSFVATKAVDQRTAELQALKACNDDLKRSRSPGPCFLYAVGNRVVLPLRLQDAMTPAAR